jgi:hypothetical protein
LGLVYLTRSGPTYNIEGAGLNTSENDKAVALFNEIIASQQFQLLSSYNAVFAYDNENNKEVIFDVQFMSSSNGAAFQVIWFLWHSGQGKVYLTLMAMVTVQATLV